MRLRSMLILAGFFAATPAYAAMTLTSGDLVAGGAMAPAQVFNQFGCTGANQSPALAWAGAPQGTKSFAITAYDPDAPTGSGWWHWVVFHIPVATSSIATDASRSGLPQGAVQARTDFGSTGYGGACPPVGHGVHRYQFTVYALPSEQLRIGEAALDAETPAAIIGRAVQANALDHATIEVLYSR